MRKKIEGSGTGPSAEESPQSATERTTCNLTAFIYFIYFLGFFLPLFILMKYFTCMKDHGLKNNTKTVTHILAAASEIEGLFFNEKKIVIQA